MRVLFFLFLFSNLAYFFLLDLKGTPYEIGEEIGGLLKEEILEIFSLKSEKYKPCLDEWESLAERSLEVIEREAPNSFEEMKGMSSVEGLSMKIISMMNVEYEMSLSLGGCSSMENEFDNLPGCTAWVSAKDGYFICGQTNDESAPSWANENGLVTIKTEAKVKNGKEDEVTTSIFFTHPGILAYYGMSTKGNVLLSTYIDNGEYEPFEPFLPNTIILRESLYLDDLCDIANLIKNAPRAVPVNYLIVNPEEGFVDIETSPTKFTMMYTPLNEPNGKGFSDICHTNNILYDLEMRDNDLKMDPSSPERLKFCQKRLKEIRTNEGGMTIEKGKELLLSPPIQRNGSFHDVYSLADMIFDPQQMKMYIKYYGEQNQFKEYQI